MRFTTEEYTPPKNLNVCSVWYYNKEMSYSAKSYDKLVESIQGIFQEALVVKTELAELVEKLDVENDKDPKGVISTIYYHLLGTLELLGLVEELGNERLPDIESRNISKAHLSRFREDVVAGAERTLSSMEESFDKSGLSTLEKTDRENIERAYSISGDVLYSLIELGDITHVLEKYIGLRPLDRPYKEETKKQRYISREKGQYYIGDEKIRMSENTLQSKVFDIIYDKRDEDGFISYEEIEYSLIDKGYSAEGNRKKRNKRIQNALSEKNGLFWRTKVGGNSFTNKAPDGERIIEIQRGTGVKFHNPYIE